MGEVQSSAAVIVRYMEEKDLQQVAELESLCFSEAWSLKLLRDSFLGQWDTLFVAELQRRVCGYAILRIVAGEGEIQRIAVHPDFRRLGIGSKLMEAMDVFSREKKTGATTLEVRAGNTGAIGLYKSYGFVEEGLRKGYYRNPVEDAVIMWKRRP